MKTGDMIVNLYLKDKWRTDNKFGTRIVFPSDSERVLDFVRKEFPNEKGWLQEINHALHETKCVISVIHNEIIGFACYDCTGKGYFGPFGVAKKHRAKGVGTELLYECFDNMKHANYGYAIIGWVDDTAKGFYEKTSNALYIPNSSPDKTLYKRRIKTGALEFCSLNYREDTTWCSSLEVCVTRLLKFKENGELVKYNFNGHWLFSDTVTMESAYLEVFGKNKANKDLVR